MYRTMMKLKPCWIDWLSMFCVSDSLRVEKNNLVVSLNKSTENAIALLNRISIRDLDFTMWITVG